MSDDLSSIKPGMNKDERITGLDLFSYLGEGVLARETMSNSSGLTPLHPGVHIKNPNSSSTDEGLSATETLKHSSGLTPLHPGTHIKNPNSSSTDEGFSTTETLRNSSGLTPLRPGGEIYKKRGDLNER